MNWNGASKYCLANVCAASHLVKFIKASEKNVTLVAYTGVLKVIITKGAGALRTFSVFQSFLYLSLQEVLSSLVWQDVSHWVTEK